MTRTTSPGRATADRVARGFTLLELLVVTALVAIVLALASLSLRGAEARQLREEAERLVALVRLASDESALDGRVLELSFSERNYEFLRLEPSGKWSVIAGDDLLRKRTLAGDLKILSVSIEAKRLLFSPSGEPPVFSVTMGNAQALAIIAGEADGTLTIHLPDA